MDLRERRRERERKRRQKRRMTAVVLLAIALLAAVLSLTMCGGHEKPVTEPIASPEPIETSEPTPTPTPVPTNANEALAQMTLDEKIMQLFAVNIDSLTGVENTTLHGNTSRKNITEAPIGMLVYTAGNIEGKNQTASMLNSLQTQYREENGFKVLLAVAEEGGEASPAARAGIGENMGEMYSFAQGENFEGAYNAGLKKGKALAQVGFNLNLAPNCEVHDGEDSETLSSIVISVADGVRDGGVLSAYKSFPGTNATTSAELSERAVLPFRTAISAGAELMAVKSTAACSAELITNVLRGELDFDGVIMTDAITEDMCVRAISAGCDILYLPTGYKEGIQRIKSALTDGVLTEERINESARRILTLKYSI